MGKEFRDTFIGSILNYELVAPSDGTLVARLSWNPQVNGAKVMLTIGDTPFRGSAPEWAPVVGRVTVSAGPKYRVRIEEGHAPWDYHFNDMFVLSTHIG